MVEEGHTNTTRRRPSWVASEDKHEGGPRLPCGMESQAQQCGGVAHELAWVGWKKRLSRLEDVSPLAHFHSQAMLWFTFVQAAVLMVVPFFPTFFYDSAW